MAAVAVAIVDDHPIAAEGLERRLLDAGCAVAATVSAVEHLDGEPDIVICDLHLPGRSGAAAIEHLVRRGLCVLATSGVATADEILDAVASGARGYVAKTAPAAVFIGAVHDVAAGSRFVSAELAAHLSRDAERRPLPSGDVGPVEREALRRFAQGDVADEVASRLGLSRGLLDAVLGTIWDAATRRRRRLMPSPRERQLMILSAAGLSHKEMAAAMSIAVTTVSDHLKGIKAKYLATHPEAPEDVTPLGAARAWAQELRLTPGG